jgi:hypothetical protein
MVVKASASYSRAIAASPQPLCKTCRELRATWRDSIDAMEPSYAATEHAVVTRDREQII